LWLLLLLTVVVVEGRELGTVAEGSRPVGTEGTGCNRMAGMAGSHRLVVVA
jgi:hypothetical protein